MKTMKTMMTMMTMMMTVIIMIAMLMSIVPTTMAEAEEVLRIFEEVMTVITVASKVFINKVITNIHKNNNNQQSSKDIFMNESEVEIEEEVSSFDDLLLLNNNNEPSSMTTRPSLLWWFTKDVLRRTTEGRTQLDKDEEGAEAEAEQRSTNREIKVRGGSLVEEGSREESTQERFYPKMRTPTYTRFASSLCVLWQVKEAIL